MNRIAIVAGFLFSLYPLVSAEGDLSSVSQSLDRRLQQAQAELSRLHETIESEKTPLVRERDNLEAQVIALRQEVEKKESLKGGRSAELRAVEREKAAREEEVKYLTALLNDYTTQFASRVHISELQRYQEEIDTARLGADNPNLNASEKFSRQLPLLETSLGRIRDLLAGTTFEGEALANGGRQTQGSFLLLGPTAYFLANDGSVAGLVDTKINAAGPTVFDVGEENRAAVKSLVQESAGMVPIDPTMGNARKIQNSKPSWSEHIKQGGPVMVPILGLGLLSVLIGIYKWQEIARVRTANSRDLQVILEHLKAGHRDKARAHADSIGGPSGVMLHRAIDNADQEKELIEEVLYEQMLETRPKLEKLMPVVALTAAVAPLLGLLGTVTGMINTFNLISVFGTGDPRMLSSGISEALVTTEYGLIVAIPALLIHAVVSRKTKGVLGSMEQAAVAFVNGVPSRNNSPEAAA